MAWVEVIQLRTNIEHRRRLESELNRLHDEVAAGGEKQGIRVFRGLIDTDYCIHILNESDKVEAPGSCLGLRLVAALKEFCFARHQVWVEMKKR